MLVTGHHSSWGRAKPNFKCLLNAKWKKMKIFISTYKSVILLTHNVVKNINTFNYTYNCLFLLDRVKNVFTFLFMLILWIIVLFKLKNWAQICGLIFGDITMPFARPQDKAWAISCTLKVIFYKYYAFNTLFWSKGLSSTFWKILFIFSKTYFV